VCVCVCVCKCVCACVCMFAFAICCQWLLHMVAHEYFAMSHFVSKVFQHAAAGLVRPVRFGVKLCITRRLLSAYVERRDCPGAGTYDAVVSCEMIEAVGHEHLTTYFAQIGRMLKPGGRAVIQVPSLLHLHFPSRTLTRQTHLCECVF
jgi:hypothetical protein